MYPHPHPNDAAKTFRPLSNSTLIFSASPPRPPRYLFPPLLPLLDFERRNPHPPNHLQYPLTTSNSFAILLPSVMALSPTSQAPAGFFLSKIPPPKFFRICTLQIYMIPRDFKSHRMTTIAKSWGGVSLPASILDFTSTPAYRTLSVAFPMTYATLQRRQQAPILPPRFLNIRSSARLR